MTLSGQLGGHPDHQAAALGPTRSSPSTRKPLWPYQQIPDGAALGLRLAKRPTKLSPDTSRKIVRGFVPEPTT
jgi:hypothetical protein